MQTDDKAIPVPRTQAITVTWTPAEGPILCLCSHDHYGWIVTKVQSEEGPTLIGSWHLDRDGRWRSSGGALAPQWTWCDSEGCRCVSLRRVATEAGHADA